ncbi:MAG: hypothetical protein VX252_00845 [Myxococcota bacterium]|nr:hypothetical protein [Myxococcota bacterium]
MNKRKSRKTEEGVILLALMLCFSVGCSSFWTSVREGERSRSVKQANTYFKDGRCGRVLNQLDRAEAAPDLGSYGAQATYQRAVCLENLGHKESARANYWMVVDFYPDSPMKSLALKKLGRSGDQRSLSAIQGEVSSLPILPDIEIPSPRYSETAERSALVGDVILVFKMDSDEKVSDIRVVHMDHPLLASWSIEAAAAAKIHEGAPKPDLPVQTVARLVFTSFWHGDGEEAPDQTR